MPKRNILDSANIDQRKEIGDILSDKMAAAIQLAYSGALEATGFDMKKINRLNDKWHSLEAKEGRRFVMYFLIDYFKDYPLIIKRVILDSLCVAEDNKYRIMWGLLKRSIGK